MIPQRTRNGLKAGAVLLVTIAAISNIGHTRMHADRHMPGDGGPWPWVVAFLPDIGLVLSILRLKYDRSSVWGWGGVVLSGGFVSWAAISTGRQYPSGWIVSLAAVAFAILATGLMHDPSGETREEFLARHEEAVARAEQAARTAIASAEEHAQKAITDASTALAASDAKVTELETKVTELTARLSSAMTEPVTNQAPALPVPKRQPRRVNVQANPEIPEGLTDAERDVLLAMLGQGEMTRADIIKDSRRLETTVKAALRTLGEKRYVVSERRGIYRATTPGIEGPWATDGDGPKGSVEGQSMTEDAAR